MPATRRQAPILPTTPIRRVIRPVERFLHVQSASGGVLLLCALIAVAAANSPYHAAYQGI